jgi:hypothetical protein
MATNKSAPEASLVRNTNVVSDPTCLLPASRTSFPSRGESDEPRAMPATKGISVSSAMSNGSPWTSSPFEEKILT